MIAYTENETLLSINNVSKDYDGKQVLKNVNAVIRDIHVEGEVKGQVVGFIGPSGIGKSTLFRIMAGLESPTSGSVVLDGDTHPVQAGEVGVVAQNYPLFNHRTVYGNLDLVARKRWNSRETDYSSVVPSYLKEFGLEDKASVYPAQLSGGQRQRVAILQQILAGNFMILMDEPFSGLDLIAKKKAQDLIVKVANLSEKNTIVVVTHDIASAAAISDHIWALGRQWVDGKPVPGASIVETYNLIDRDLAWHPEIERTPEFSAFVQEVSERFKTL